MANTEPGSIDDPLRWAVLEIPHWRQTCPAEDTAALEALIAWRRQYPSRAATQALIEFMKQDNWPLVTP
jgi:hypothetical protein